MYFLFLYEKDFFLFLSWIIDKLKTWKKEKWRVSSYQGDGVHAETRCCCNHMKNSQGSCVMCVMNRLINQWVVFVNDFLSRLQWKSCFYSCKQISSFWSGLTSANCLGVCVSIFDSILFNRRNMDELFL